MTDKELGTAAGDIFAKAFTLGYETGRTYVPAGGMALTAEQVEDVRTVLNKFGFNEVTPEVVQAIEASKRLTLALFPATEPGENPCGSNSIIHGWCTLTVRHDGLHTNGTYFWGQTPAPAEAAEEEAKAEGSVGTVCDETQKTYDEAVSLSYWLAKQLGEHVDEAYDRGETLTDTVQRLIEHIRPNLGKTKTASSPVVPTQEGAKAEGRRCPGVSKFDERCNKKSGHTGKHHAFNHTWGVEEFPTEADGLAVSLAEDCLAVMLNPGSEEEGEPTSDPHELAVALWRADLLKVEASSPVVPAPTETEWQTLAEVPIGVARVVDVRGRVLSRGDHGWKPYYLPNATAPFMAMREQS